MTSLFLIVILIIFNAIFAASEVAIIASNDAQVEADALAGNKRAKRINKFIKKPTSFLSAIQIGITLVGFLNGYLAADAYSGTLVEFAQSFVNIKTSILSPVMTILVTIILAYFQVVFGELVPKRIAMKYPEKIAYGTSGILVVVDIFMRPFVWLLTISANGIVRIFGINPKESAHKMTEEEIRMIVTTSGRKGVIDKIESQMIENILDFDDTEVGDVMTHRTEIRAININTDRKQVMDFVKKEIYTRFPVYENDIDHIVGILHAKDLLSFIDSNETNFNLRELIRKPFFVTKTKKINTLLNEMNHQQTHLAIVVDEYGGTAGLITIEDLLEEIVGEIFDEYDYIEEDIKEISENVYIVDGLADIDDVEEIIQADLPTEEHATLSGFLLEQFERFPNKDEPIEIIYNNFKFEALNFDDKVITEVKVTRLKPLENENDDKQVTKKKQ